MTGVAAEPDPADISTPLSNVELLALCQLYAVRPGAILALEPWQQLALRHAIVIRDAIREPARPRLSRWRRWRTARQIARAFGVPWRLVR